MERNFDCKPKELSCSIKLEGKEREEGLFVGPVCTYDLTLPRCLAARFRGR